MRFSWSYLFTQYGYGDNQDGSKGARSYPIDHILSGYFTWNTSRLYQKTFGGYNWSSSVQSNDAGYRLTISGDNVKYSVTLTKLYGLPLRCVFGSKYPSPTSSPSMAMAIIRMELEGPIRTH